MTREDIVCMAREAGMVVVEDKYTLLPFLERFAQLVEKKATEAANARSNASWTLMCEKMVEAEREACADLADSMDPLQDGAIAQAIRARGQQ